MKTNLPSRTPLGSSFKPQFFFLLMLFSSVGVWAQISESFETGLPGSYNSTLSNATLSSGPWQVKDVVAGMTGVNTGTKSAQLRSATASQIITPTLSGGVGLISFYVTASTTSGTYQVNISTDNGINWTAATGSPYTISTTTTLRSITVNNGSVNKVQIYRTGSTIYIDDFAATTYSSAITSNGTGGGNWDLTATWVGGVRPTSADDAIIANGDVVTMNSGTYSTRNSGTTTTVNAGGTLATNQNYINNGTTTINGSFQLDNGGWVSDISGTNALIYGTDGTLIFNNTYTANSGNYWPTTSGPKNVTVNSGAPFTLGFNRTVTGTFQTSAGVTLSSTLTLNGINQLNGGGYFNSAPTYGSASALVYNATYGVSNEWTGNGAAGVGIPANVTVQAGTLSLPNVNRGIPGNISINSGTTLNLNNASGDLYVGGNFTVGASGNFNPFGRAVFFNGGATQTITKTGSGAISFDYITINKSGDNVVLSSAPATDISLNATSGDFLRMISASSFDLNGRTMSLNNIGGGIYVDGARTITSSVSGGKIEVNQYKRVSNNSGTGALTLAANVTVNLNANGNFDFGKSSGVTITTLNGTLSINSTTSCYVNTNPPIYGVGSLLKYNSTGSYGRGVEWSTISGAGFPSDVQVSNNTTLDVPNTGGTFSTNLALSRDLAVDSGSSLYMDYGAGAASGALTVGRNVNISGNLSLGDTAPGDLFVAGTWTRTGVFTPNGRLVTFNGASAQTLTGATTFDYLTLNNATGLTLLTANPVIVNQTLGLTNGKLTLGANDLTEGGTITGASSTNYVVTNGTGQLKRTVAATSVQFPIGPTDTKYNPISATNTGTSDVYGFHVATGVTGAADINFMVNNSWFVSEANVGGSNLKVVPTWNVSDEGGSFSASDNTIELYPATITTYDATVTGQSAVLTNSGDNFSTSFDGSQFFVVGKRRPSKISDIIIDPSFAYTSNINYTPFINSNITALNSVELANFIIRDGGATSDSDSFATVLNSIGFTVVNVANLDRLAIYDGTTEIAEVAAAATTNFTGLTLTAPDNSTKTFTIRGSFKTVVTDNQQIQLTVASATANAATSTFATTNASGASSSSTADDNRVEVTADRLAFTTQPTNTGINSPMSNVVISATDINNNKDFDQTGSVSVTSTGTLTGALVSQTISAGTGSATFTNLTHTVIGTGLKLTAALTGFSGVESSTFDITTITFLQGDYQSLTTGTWLGTGTATWEKYNSVTGWAPSIPPASNTSNAVYIGNGTIITTGNAFGGVNIKVLSGGIFNCTFNSTAASLYIYDGGTASFSGNPLKITNDFEIEDDGTFIYAYSSNAGNSSYVRAALWNGTEKFHPNSNFIIKDHKTGANNYFLPVADADINTQNYNGIPAYFGNLIIDLGSAGDNNSFKLTSSNTATDNSNFNNKILTYNDLVFRSSSLSTNVNMFYGGTNLTINGNLKIENTFTNTNINVTPSTSAVSGILTINGDFQNESAKSFTLVSNAAGNITLNVNGNIKLNTTNTNSSSLNLSSAGTGTINLKGDLAVGSTSTLTAVSGTTSTFNFTGIGDGTTDARTQTIDVANQSTISNIIFNSNSGSYCKLINQNLSLGTNSKFNVLSNSTLNFGFDGVYNPITNFSAGTSALNLVYNGNLQTFTASTGSTLKITSSAGINITGTSALGNVQTPLAGRTFDAGTIYHYIGKANQSTGNGLPEGLTNKLIVDLQTDATNENLNLNVDGIVKFNSTGILEIRRGKVIDIPLKGFRNNVLVDDENNETDAQKGNILMTGGRYVVSGSGTKPSLSGTYAISAGTVEFAGTAATKIRTSSSPVKQYFNIDISGINVETGGKSLIVNNLLKVTAATAFLTVPETADIANPYVVTAKKGIQILVTGGKILFKNNAHLLQDETGVINTGKITMERIAKLPARGYNYWGSPVSGQQTKGAGGFSPDTPNNRFFSYRESNDRFYETGDLTFVTGKGYAVKGTAATGVGYAFKFVGTPNNAGINVAVTKSIATKNPIAGQPDDIHGFNLISNPYPSTLDFDKFYINNSAEIWATALFWTNNDLTITQQQGSGYGGVNYAIYNFSGGTPAPYLGPLTTLLTPTGLIKPGQGFIVQVKGAVRSTSLNFDNTMRGTGATVFFNKTGKASSIVKDRFHLALTTPSSINSVILLAYVHGATDDYEQDFDAELVAEGSDSFFSKLNSKKLAIQGRSYPFVHSDVVPLGAVYYETGIHTISLQDKEGVFSDNQNIYLKDNQTGTITNLNEGSYSFNANAGQQIDRFEIIYKPETILATNDNTKNEVVVYRNGEDFVIQSSSTPIKEVELYDIIGRMLLKVKSNLNKVTIDSSSISSGVYILKIKRNNETISKKLVK